MKTTLTVITVLGLTVLAGCNGAGVEKELAVGDKTFLTVDFQEAQPLRYKFVSRRDIDFEWEPDGKPGKNTKDKFLESVEMVVVYKPVKVDPYGLTTIEAKCESVKTGRSSSTAKRQSEKDAVKSFSGRTFTFTVAPTGRIEDYSQLDALIREVGKKAFRSRKKGGRIKNPDSIGDFIATQWFLWDSVSSIEKAAKGLKTGQSWKSKLSVPTTIVMRKARDVIYVLDEIRQNEKGRLAVIRSSYSLAETAPKTWPIPYVGSFRMSGRFGMLRNYKVLDLQGQGEELFNIDAGRTEKYEQKYKMQLLASFPLSLGIKPRITINQTLTMQLLK